MSRLEEKVRIKQLLVDAITLLCRNGMQFENKFCIEALVAITLDEQDVVLININETIETSGDYSNDRPESTEKIEKITKTFKKRKHKSKTDSTAYNDNALALNESGSFQSNDDGGLRLNVKYEAGDGNNYSGDNEDEIRTNLVPENEADDCYFVKSENLDENNDNGWSNMNADNVYGNIDHNGIVIAPDSYTYQTAPQRKPRVREKSVINKSNWRSLAPRMIRPKQSAVIQDQIQENGEYMAVGYQLNKWQCSLCSTIYSSERVLREHVKAIHFHKMLGHCKDCGESFKWRHQLHKHKRSCPAIFNT